MRIAVTGSTGKLGTVVTHHLRSAGHEVIGLDVTGARGPGFVKLDLTDYGQVVEALGGVGDQHDGVEAVVHLAAIPAPKELDGPQRRCWSTPLRHQAS